MAKTRLLTLTHWLLNAGIVLCLFGFGVLVLCEGALLAMTNDWVADHFHVPAVLDSVARGHVLLTIAAAVAGGMTCLLLAMLALRNTNRIVETAMNGDPFVVENAARLSRLGWQLLGIYATGIAVGAVVNILLPAAMRNSQHISHVGGGPDLSPVGLLAILLIFVLAQIFRHGSEMRAELQGTV